MPNMLYILQSYWSSLLTFAAFACNSLADPCYVFESMLVISICHRNSILSNDDSRRAEMIMLIIKVNQNMSFVLLIIFRISWFIPDTHSLVILNA